MMYALHVTGWWSKVLPVSVPPEGRALLGMGRRTVLLLTTMLSTVLLAGGVTLAVTPKDAPPGTGQATLQNAQGRDAALDAALRSLVARRGGPPGAIAVVQRGSHREVHAFGVRNVKRGLPMRANDRMRIASTSKAFNGAVALSLVSKGKLSLNDTIGELLSDLPKPPPHAWADVTLGQLLKHKSGLPDYLEDPDFQKALENSPTKAPPPEKLLSYVYDHDPPLLFDPGSRYQYSNTDNIAVGLMVEAATGTTYESQLHKQVYGPLGLSKKTTLPAGAKLRRPFRHDYDVREDPPEDISESVAAGWAWASGGMVSTPYDLNDFIRGYVGGDLFDQRTRAKQRRVVEGGGEPPGPGINSAGLGIFRYQTRCGTVWGHTGNFFGDTQFMAASPDGRRSATVSINTRLVPTFGDPGAQKALVRAEGLAVCAALAEE
jgi:D-alanyl-D-alanine carboxypeptidase